MIFSWLTNLFKTDTPVPEVVAPPGTPFYWEDDFLQVEITDRRNRASVLKEIEAIKAFSGKHATPQGFTDIYVREDHETITTISLELNFEPLDRLLKEYLHKATHIQYEASKLIDCSSANDYAYQADNFTIFVDLDDEYVKYIWVRCGTITTTQKFDSLLNALYIIGESYEMDLVDWNTLEYVELNNRVQIKNYLADWRG